MYNVRKNCTQHAIEVEAYYFLTYLLIQSENSRHRKIRMHAYTSKFQVNSAPAVTTCSIALAPRTHVVRGARLSSTNAKSLLVLHSSADAVHSWFFIFNIV